MMLITIEVKHESMVVHHDKLKGCREVWRASGLIVFVKGPLDKQRFDQARHIAMQFCESVNIPVISLRKTGNQLSYARQFKTETRRMF